MGEVTDMHEGEDGAGGHAVPAELIEIAEALQWQAAVEAAK